LVGTYNEKIANNRKVELILLSADRNAETALKWSMKENFPWPQVMKDSIPKGAKFMEHRGRFVPQHVLVDKNGEMVAQGLQAALQKMSSFRFFDVFLSRV